MTNRLDPRSALVSPTEAANRRRRTLVVGAAAGSALATRPRTTATLPEPSFIAAKKQSLEVFQREVRR